MKLNCLILFLFVLFLPLITACQHQLDPQKLRVELIELNNHLRQFRKITQFKTLSNLEIIASDYSVEMAEKRFFNTMSPDKLIVSDRLQAAWPGYFCSGIIENIALLPTISLNEKELAKQIFESWRNSPKYYKTIVDPDYIHIGVGVKQSWDRVYVTQLLAASLVELVSTLPKQIYEGSELILKFNFLADFPPSSLYADLYIPNGKEEIMTETGQRFFGKKPLSINWLSERSFELRIPVVFGPGRYQLAFGSEEYISLSHFIFKAKAQLEEENN